MEDHEKIVEEYIKNDCKSLLYQDVDTINIITSKMKKNIEEYAKTYSDVYKNLNSKKLLTRKDFDEKELWISKKINKSRLIERRTSGSTTGVPFSFRNDSKYYTWIQNNCEFDLILKEFGLFDKPLKILNLMDYPVNPKFDQFYLETKNFSKNKFHSFNAKEFTTFFINFSNYSNDLKGWYEKLLEFFNEHNNFDIILCAGPIVNILTKFITNSNFKIKICNLLSHTTQFPRQEDFEFLKSNENINHFCDHMRCWDGGATFFTCIHGTKHLLDNFSWVEQGPNNELISTDYLNLATPFVNYWNGDLCEIINEYVKCKCGRWYRPFNMLRNRPFSVKGPSSIINLRKQILELNFKDKIAQIQFDGLKVNIFLEEKLDENSSEILVDLFKDYEVKINFL